MVKMSSALTYYTQMALSHASIIVASVFGLFSVLRIISNKDRSPQSKHILTGLYIILLLFGMYEIARYRFYSDKAKSLAHIEFGETDWWREWYFLKPISDVLWNYSLLIYFAFGAVALIGVYDELRNLLWNSIVELKRKRK